METNKKTIQINPDLFKINGGNTTRKNKNKTPNDKIRMRTPDKTKKMSTIKRNILKMIRNHQDERRRKEHIERKKETDSIDSFEPKFHNSLKEIDSHQFQTEFNESLDYLSNLTKEVDQKKQSYTIKRYPSTQVSSQVSSNNVSLLSEPSYGCLKNGKLPTYRNWLNQTRRNYPELQPSQQQITIQQPSHSLQRHHPQINIQNPPPSLQPQPQQINIQNLQNSSTKINEIKMNDHLKQFSKIQQFEKKNQPIHQPTKWKYPKQKRTIRRTYYVGRSRVHPRVSVLVSNKTIRARTTLKQQELKQVPISEVRKYLLKHGFIKIGTSSPNDVLREMYESAQLICGEIKNHNSDNLLYNYFNAPTSSEL